MSPLFSEEAPPPVLSHFKVDGSRVEFRFPPYPSAESYRILSASNTVRTFSPDDSFSLYARTNWSTNGSRVTSSIDYVWRSTNVGASAKFYQAEITPMESNDVLAATVLDRLTYGPTPDELDRIKAIGTDAYIAELLAPWSVVENAEEVGPGIASIGRRLPQADTFVQLGHAELPDLRAWHVLRAVNARRQLLEIMLQFLENHFVTEYGKSYRFFNRYYRNTPYKNLRKPLATKLEYLENSKWRTALLNPECTFYDLLRISAESPAMLIYLDTVDSRGDGKRIANENYARELCELFCLGVDNGYDQDDIVAISQGWTGWRIEKVAPEMAGYPFAPKTTTLIPGTTDTSTAYYNLYGVWAFNYKEARHNNSIKYIFKNKTVPGRFGPPWAGRNYQLTLDNGGGMRGIRDGYQIIAHLANLPFTQEYISIKLCRLLIHDGFPNPTTNPDLPEYHYYDYRRDDLSPEARLIHECMNTWESAEPRGQIWKVLETIVRSDLFRSRAANSQKVKNPLEFAVSAIRALRTAPAGTTYYAADTDGYSISGSSSDVDNASKSPLNRMGRMLLFDREEPDGYPEEGPSWISAGTLAERIRFIQSYLTPIQTRLQGDQGDNDAGRSYCHPSLLIHYRLPESERNNATAVADLFLQLLFPGEGAGNLALYHTAAVEFLNTDDAGNPSPFAALQYAPAPGSPYDLRVRGMVGFLMSLPRFQEQ